MGRIGGSVTAPSVASAIRFMGVSGTVWRGPPPPPPPPGPGGWGGGGGGGGGGIPILRKIALKAPQF